MAKIGVDLPECSLAVVIMFSALLRGVLKMGEAGGLTKEEVIGSFVLLCPAVLISADSAGGYCVLGLLGGKIEVAFCNMRNGGAASDLGAKEWRSKFSALCPSDEMSLHSERNSSLSLFFLVPLLRLSFAKIDSAYCMKFSRRVVLICSGKSTVI